MSQYSIVDAFEGYCSSRSWWEEKILRSFWNCVRQWVFYSSRKHGILKNSYDHSLNSIIISWNLQCITQVQIQHIHTLVDAFEDDSSSSRSLGGRQPVFYSSCQAGTLQNSYDHSLSSMIINWKFIMYYYNPSTKHSYLSGCFQS